MVSSPGLERIRTVVPQNIVAVEALGGEQARVLVEFEILEMVNGQLLGRTTEKREIFDISR